jgi:type II secretory pathway predicted ATPase ExeA
MMSEVYRSFFGLQREPFTADISLREILVTPDIKAVTERLQYTIRLGAAALVTGEIGSGKSTALRHVTGNLHPSKYRVIYVTATSGSILELYRQIINEMGLDVSSNSRAVLTKTIKQEVLELSNGKRMKVVLVIDEASLLRLTVFAELHTLTQFENDSKPFFPLILAGQNNLVENLRFRDSLPLASRVVAKKHLQGVDREAMEKYLDHHQTLAGIKTSLFEEGAVTAIHQGAGGLFRKANHLARGAMIAAAKGEQLMVTAEHVRLAATELL